MIVDVINNFKAATKKEANTEMMAIALGMNELVFSIPKMWKQERLKSKVKRWRKQSK
jgi:hypothetical protein|tara:strand:+ start:1577 stop:1747 length:171 start_codon:yes stop_codon:yes gene_type:complete